MGLKNVARNEQEGNEEDDNYPINGRKVSLVTDRIWTETAMGMIYRYDDIPGVTLDAVACTAVFRGLDITRAVAKRFNLPSEEFVRAGEICNQRLEVCAIEHDPLLILTPRVALQEKTQPKKLERKCWKFWKPAV